VVTPFLCLAVPGGSRAVSAAKGATEQHVVHPSPPRSCESAFLLLPRYRTDSPGLYRLSLPEIPNVFFSLQIRRLG
jgi:hypothetical protein